MSGIFYFLAFLKYPLEKHVSELSTAVRILRQRVRGGLVKARLRGAQQARGEILVFLDAHCEVTKGELLMNRDLSNIYRWILRLARRVSDADKRGQEKGGVPYHRHPVRRHPRLHQEL